MIPARPTLLRHALRAGPLVAVAALSQAGCYFSDEGLTPPAQAFYFPTGLAVSPGRSALYVASSDFDLQYNGGTINVVDLVATRAKLTRMLTGLRCSQQAQGACDDYVDRYQPAGGAPTSVTEVCRAIGFSEGVGATGAACSGGSECVSGVCDEQACRACSVDGDCPGSGKCGAGGVCALDENDNTILTPSACTAMAPPFAANGGTYAAVGAFASGAVLATNQDRACADDKKACLVDDDCTGGVACEVVGGARLFVPVRGDPSISWFDVVDDRGADASADARAGLECGQCRSGGAVCSVADDCCGGECSGGRCGASSVSPRCDDDHRVGVDPYDNLRNLVLPTEPVGLDVSEDGRALVSAHQIADLPAIGLSVNEWPSAAEPKPPRPTYKFTLDTGLPEGPMEVAHLPSPLLVQRAKLGGQPFGYEPGFLVSYNASAEIDLYRFNADAGSSPARPFITRAAFAGVYVNANGEDSRGLAVDDTARRACESACATMDLACLRGCVDVPIDFFVANRSPASLLLGRVRTTIVEGSGGAGSAAFDVPEIYDAVSLTVGPSKVAMGHVIGTDGKLHRRVFAVTFESRFVFSYDPEARRVDAVIRTGRGPHAITFDTGDDGDGLHSYLYVGHFTDSYLGVVDLDMRHPETFGIMFASIGTPTPPRESK